MDHLPHAIRRYLADELFRQMSPDDLWARFRDHSEEGALRVLLDRVGGRIHARCRAIVGDGPTADEAFQEAFTELFRHRAKLQTYGEAVAWLYATATNKAKSHRRWWRRVWHRDRAKAAATPHECYAPNDLSNHEEAERVTRALADLPERERQALELVYQEGMTHTKAAEALGWDRGSVGTYVRRGLIRLRRRLDRAGVALAGVAAIEAALGAEPPFAPVARLLGQIGPALTVGTAGTGATGWLRFGKVTAISALVLGSGLMAGGLVRNLLPPPLSAEPPPVPASVVEVAPPPSVPESLPERNRRAFEATVRAPLQQALDSLLQGEGGSAVITTVTTRGTIVQVDAELRHGPPNRHVTRLELIYCTYRRNRLFNIDVWGDGKYQSANPRDPIVLAKNRVGVPDLTRPVTGLRGVQEALTQLPTDPRGAGTEAAYTDPIRKVLAAHAGTWLARGDPTRRATISKGEWWCPLGIRGPAPSPSCYPVLFDFRWSADGRVIATCGDLGGIQFSTDGTRIDFPRTGDWWVRPAAGSSSRGR